MNGDLWLVVAVLLGAAAAMAGALIAASIVYRRSVPHPEHPSQYDPTTCPYCDNGVVHRLYDPDEPCAMCDA